MKYSIVTVVWNQPEVTKKFIDSVLEHSDDYELIIVDNCSDRETTDMLESYAENSNVSILHMGINAGWVGGVNNGVMYATGEFVVVCNNDIQATAGWLEGMSKHMQGKVGLVGPDTDNISGAQKNLKGTYEASFLVGFCFMLKREVLRKLMKGGYFLDPAFGMGNSDDLDMCIRVKNHGFSIVITSDSFVHHNCSTSFKEYYKKDFDKLYNEDLVKKMEILEKKWSKNEVSGMIDEQIIAVMVTPPEKPKKDHIEILMAVPSATGKMPLKLVSRLLTMKVPENVSCAFAYTERVLVDRARNILIKNQGDYDYVFFIDDDTIPPNDALMKMLELDKDIVAPAIPDRNGEPTIALFDDNIDRMKELKETRQVGAVGMACTLIKRKVIDAMVEKFADPFEAQKGDWEKDGVTKFTRLGEDVNFCVRAVSLGFEVWAIHGVYPEHIGNPVHYQYSDSGKIKKLVKESPKDLQDSMK